MKVSTVSDGIGGDFTIYRGIEGRLEDIWGLFGLSKVVWGLFGLSKVVWGPIWSIEWGMGVAPSRAPMVWPEFPSGCRLLDLLVLRARPAQPWCGGSGPVLRVKVRHGFNETMTIGGAMLGETKRKFSFSSRITVTMEVPGKGLWFCGWFVGFVGLRGCCEGMVSHHRQWLSSWGESRLEVSWILIGGTSDGRERDLTQIDIIWFGDNNFAPQKGKKMVTAISMLRTCNSCISKRLAKIFLLMVKNMTSFDGEIRWRILRKLEKAQKGETQAPNMEEEVNGQKGTLAMDEKNDYAVEEGQIDETLMGDGDEEYFEEDSHTAVVEMDDIKNDETTREVQEGCVLEADGEVEPLAKNGSSLKPIKLVPQGQKGEKKKNTDSTLVRLGVSSKKRNVQYLASPQKKMASKNSVKVGEGIYPNSTNGGTGKLRNDSSF